MTTDSLSPKDGTAIIDFRQAADFDLWHLPEAINAPLESLVSDSASPFFDAVVLEQQWTELEAVFQRRTDIVQLNCQQLLLLCYDGDTARVATSILRARNIAASCVRGGVTALLQDLPTLRTHVGHLSSFVDDMAWKSSHQQIPAISIHEVCVPLDSDHMSG